MIHPDFNDENMTMDNFKHNIVDVDSGRVKGAQFDVDYTTAQAGGWNVVASSPASPASAKSTSSMRALQLGAFQKKQLSRGLNSEDAKSMRTLFEKKVQELQQQLAAKDARIAELEAQVASLQK